MYPMLNIFLPFPTSTFSSRVSSLYFYKTLKDGVMYKLYFFGVEHTTLLYLSYLFVLL